MILGLCDCFRLLDPAWHNALGYLLNLCSRPVQESEELHRSVIFILTAFIICHRTNAVVHLQE